MSLVSEVTPILSTLHGLLLLSTNWYGACDIEGSGVGIFCRAALLTIHRQKTLRTLSGSFYAVKQSAVVLFHNTMKLSGVQSANAGYSVFSDLSEDQLDSSDAGTFLGLLHINKTDFVISSP